MSALRYVRVRNSTSSLTVDLATLAARQAIETYMQGVRFSCSSATIATNRPNRDYTYFEYNIDAAVAHGLKMLIGLTYSGVDSGSGSDQWDCTNESTLANFSSADQTALVDLWVDVVGYVRDNKGLSLSNGDVIFTLWNEADNDSFGATSDGVFSTKQKDLFDAAAIALRAAYPDMLLAAPSFSVIDDGFNWTGVTSANMGSPLHPVWQLCDFLDAHFYFGSSDCIPPIGFYEQRRNTQLGYQNFIDAIEALPDHRRISSLPVICSEQGKNYVEAGMNTTRWVYGQSEQRARMIAAQYLQLAQNDRMKLIATYYNRNESSSNTRASLENFGVHLYEGEATKLKQALARIAGTVLDDSLITAAEPT